MNISLLIDTVCLVLRELIFPVALRHTIVAIQKVNSGVLLITHNHVDFADWQFVPSIKKKSFSSNVVSPENIDYDKPFEYS